MIYAWIALILFLTDYVIKKNVDAQIKDGEEKKILKDKIIIKKYYNKGAILSSFSDKPKLVIRICQGIMLVLAMIWASLLRERQNKGLKLGITLLLAGGMNNLWDRMTKGHVVDYFSFNVSKGKLKNIVFNISDMFIFLGGLLTILFHSIRKEH